MRQPEITLHNLKKMPLVISAAHVRKTIHDIPFNLRQPLRDDTLNRRRNRVSTSSTRHDIHRFLVIWTHNQRLHLQSLFPRVTPTQNLPLEILVSEKRTLPLQLGTASNITVLEVARTVHPVIHLPSRQACRLIHIMIPTLTFHDFHPS